jgi:hypothetical protein
MADDSILEDEVEESPENAEEDSPEQIEDETDVPTYGENNRQLPSQLKDALAALVKSTYNRDLYDRRIEVLTDRIHRFYDDGVQHVYPNFGTGVYQVGTSGGFVDLPDGSRMQCPEYMGAYNIFRSRRRSIHAVLTQNPPGIDFIPNKLGDPEGEQSAEIAEGFRHYFDTHNDAKMIQEDISRMMCLSGRTVVYTYQTKDGARWGYNDQGEPLTMETAKVYGTLESRVPITCKYFDKMLFCILYDDVDALLLKQQNPWIKKHITAGESGLGESDWERFARLGTRQARKGFFLTGDAYFHLTTEMQVFFRPGMFEHSNCEDAFSGEMPEGAPKNFGVDEDRGYPTVRSMLNALFPEGAHVKYIGKTYSEATNDSMDDAIDIGFPDRRDGMTGGALMEPMKVIQDTFNDYKNAERENYEKGWPATYFHGTETDYNTIADTPSRPKMFHLVKDMPQGSNISDHIFQEQGFDIPQSFTNAQNDMRGALSQDVTGALPALQGASEPDQTASGQAMDRAQAMGMLGPAWANIQRLESGMYTKAVLLAAKNPDHGEEISIAKPDGTKASFQLKKIRKGTFKAKADVDSNFPDSTAAKRANMQQLLPLAAPTPLGAAIFESPDNWDEILELNGNPDITLTPALAYKKQMRELEVLLDEAPQDNSQAVAEYQQQMDTYNQQHAATAIAAVSAGQQAPEYMPPAGPAPMPLLPSIMPEADDYHLWESRKCQEYLSSEDCWLRMNSGDPQANAQAKLGIQNVRLHKAVHDQMLAQQNAQQQAVNPPLPTQMKIPQPQQGQSPNKPNTAPPGAGGPTL